MKPEKILYVDDEAIALKYFERLVGPLAPVLVASSVEEGRAILGVHGADIAVLVCDQRMPGERGNELLRHARQHYPHIVRMLTTAYSDISEAIDAINTGEIYRYIAKPWELESLRSDLKNALELSSLRHERDGLMRDKMLAQQSQLVSGRLSALMVAAAALNESTHERAVYRCAQAVLVAGKLQVSVDWNRWDHADLQQAEARRAAGVAMHLAHWMRRWGTPVDGARALAQLGGVLGGELRDGALHLQRADAFLAVLAAPPGQVVSLEACAWPAWQIWTEGRFAVSAAPGGWCVALGTEQQPPKDWLAAAIEQLHG